MRIATWNIEWFSALFDDQDRLFADDSRSARHKISRGEQTDAIAYVIERLDADLLMIIEAPNTGLTQSSTRALERFTDAFGLRQSKAITGFPSDTQQEISAIFDPALVTARHDPLESVRVPRFDGSYQLDIDVDCPTRDACLFQAAAGAGNHRQGPAWSAAPDRRACQVQGAA